MEARTIDARPSALSSAESVQGPISRPDRTLQITRGLRRALAARGQASVTEFILKTGRRADVLSVDAKGVITIVEVKSSIADFRADRKWEEYGGFCDRFYFAVADDFPQELIPDDCGLIVADAYDATILREPPETTLAPARRKTLLLRFARIAAERLHRLEDPVL
ncbi:MAG TPA: MmcB family DNA repair protein [Alphaproteobacteria bacterium]|nr:MmcB family DNA repair protein [Alphaproteobacteria bacterium]